MELIWPDQLVHNALSFFWTARYRKLFIDSKNAVELNRVFVIEDDQSTRESIALSFEISYPGSVAVPFQQADGVLEAIANGPPDLATIDLGLPDSDGFGLIRDIRSISDVPIIVITARGDDSSLVAAIRLGADDFLIKPVTLVALQAHVEAVMRLYNRSRSGKVATRSFQTPRGTVDLDRAGIELDGVRESLSNTDILLLESLLASGGRIVVMETLKRDIWGGSDVTDSALKMAVHRLRQTIGDDDAENPVIVHHRSVGFSLPV